MNIYTEIKLRAQSAMLGCITPSMRMIKVILSDRYRKLYVVAYFDNRPMKFEEELVSDISSEIECSLLEPIFECESACVYSLNSVIDNLHIESFEKELCPEVAYSVMLYLRFGESGEEIGSGGLDELEKVHYVILDNEKGQA